MLTQTVVQFLADAHLFDLADVDDFALQPPPFGDLDMQVGISFCQFAGTFDNACLQRSAGVAQGFSRLNPGAYVQARDYDVFNGVISSA